MKIDKNQLDELRQCKIYQNILPRYQKVIEWIFEQYLELSDNEKIRGIETYYIVPQENGSIKTESLIVTNINRRKLLNLDALDFDFGLKFTSNKFQPFFGLYETGLFKKLNNKEEIEDGDICLVKVKELKQTFLATKEETGFFELDTSFLGENEEIEIIGVLVNIETL